MLLQSKAVHAALGPYDVSCESLPTYRVHHKSLSPVEYGNALLVRYLHQRKVEDSAAEYAYQADFTYVYQSIR